jgi:hypothetical protein
MITIKDSIQDNFDLNVTEEGRLSGADIVGR